MAEPARAREEPTRLALRLFVAGEAPNSLAARKNLEAALEPLDPGAVELEIVDVLDEPRRALEDGVVVTPTLVRLSPPPERRIVGSLGASERLRQFLAVENPVP